MGEACAPRHRGEPDMQGKAWAEMRGKAVGQQVRKRPPPPKRRMKNKSTLQHDRRLPQLSNVTRCTPRRCRAHSRSVRHRLCQRAGWPGHVSCPPGDSRPRARTARVDSRKWHRRGKVMARSASRTWAVTEAGVARI